MLSIEYSRSNLQNFKISLVDLVNHTPINFRNESHIVVVFVLSSLWHVLQGPMFHLTLPQAKVTSI